MRYVILFVLCVVAGCNAWGEPPKYNASAMSGMCDGFRFGDKEVLECVMAAVDRDAKGNPGNGDEKISVEEIEAARQAYLKWYERGATALFGGSAAAILKSCAGKEKYITVKSFEDNRDTCLRTQEELCRVKTKLCDRAAELLGKPVY